MEQFHWHCEITMPTVTREQIEEQIRQLPPDKLPVLAEFVAFLAARAQPTDADVAMKLSEDALRRIWDLPEEDEAWSYL
jgi:hypothetical protein